MLTAAIPVEAVIPTVGHDEPPRSLMISRSKIDLPVPVYPYEDEVNIVGEPLRCTLTCGSSKEYVLSGFYPLKD